MFRWSRYFLAAFCLIPLAVSAAEPLQWRCWYDQKIHIACLVDTVPDRAYPSSEVALPSNLPPIVLELRENPGAFHNRILHVPLHSMPLDMEFTATLAKAAMCGSRKDCTVKFTAWVPPTSEIAALMNKPTPKPIALKATGLIGAQKDQSIGESLNRIDHDAQTLRKEAAGLGTL